jgi:ABC-type transport system involved in multi-copper enzyme maturation permease subunit
MIDLMVSELRQRLRGRRWWVVLGLWALALLGLLALTRAAVSGVGEGFRLGPFMFGSLALFVLALACLVMPSLTSGSINGERQRGTLAVLQATLYRPWEIFLAKLGAATVTAAAFLAATLPLTLWCFVEGDVSVVSVLVVYLVLLVTCAVLATFGLAASALIPRPALSAVAAYAAVFALTIGSPIVFALAYSSASDPGSLGTTEVGWRWVLLAPDPIIVLADAAPSPRGAEDPLSGLRAVGRFARDPEPADPETGGPPLWPTGLVIQLLLATGAGLLAVRRLKLPAKRLGAGERVA